jgi:hypothetical protein
MWKWNAEAQRDTVRLHAYHDQGTSEKTGRGGNVLLEDAKGGDVGWHIRAAR